MLPSSAWFQSPGLWLPASHRGRPGRWTCRPRCSRRSRRERSRQACPPSLPPCARSSRHELDVDLPCTGNRDSLQNRLFPAPPRWWLGPQGIFRTRPILGSVASSVIFGTYASLNGLQIWWICDLMDFPQAGLSDMTKPYLIFVNFGAPLHYLGL